MADCAGCDDKGCYGEGRDCYGLADLTRKRFEADPELRRLHAAATSVEGDFYGRYTRLEEVIVFAERLGVKKMGIAFCIGLEEEAREAQRILSRRFEVHSVCCKAGGVSKDDMGLKKIRDDRYEAMCNPVGQAELLNRLGCELNVICGLCVGHDAIFSRVSKAPVVTLIAKDRVLAHNPAAALYCRYVRRRFEEGGKR